jgi:DNA replication protein DnaC
MTENQTLEQIRSYLKTLKLRKMEKALDEVLSQDATENLPVSKVIERLLAIEADSLIERRIERRIKDSKLPERKLLSDFDFSFQKGIEKNRIMELATLSFVERKQGLILAGRMHQALSVQVHHGSQHAQGPHGLFGRRHPGAKTQTLYSTRYPLD